MTLRRAPAASRSRPLSGSSHQRGHLRCDAVRLWAGRDPARLDEDPPTLVAVEVDEKRLERSPAPLRPRENEENLDDGRHSTTTTRSRPTLNQRAKAVENLVPPQLSSFIARHYGRRGRDWLDELPQRIERYRTEWQLEVDGFLPAGFASCCVGVVTVEGEPAVLKLCGPWTPARPEALALRCWDGGPSPRLLNADERGAGALLLERIDPGQPPSDTDDVLDEVATLVNALRRRPVPEEVVRQLPSLADVVETRIATAGAEAAARSADEASRLAPRLERTRRLAHGLLSSVDGDATLLHADLETRNILRCGVRGLVAIDPLPCVGDATYDGGYWLANFDGDEREARAAEVARRLGFDPARLLAWATVTRVEA
jgi:streptomycin 6-kinase